MIFNKKSGYFRDLEKILGINIKKEELFVEAFTHKSYLNEFKSSQECNERMEFLGDAVLELLVTDFLFERFKSEQEGILTSYRSALVCGKNLAQVAKKLDLGRFLYISKGEEKSGGREKEYILANTFEAMIGAVYLEKGSSAVNKILQKFLFPFIDEVVENNLHRDPKSYLQELAQEKKSITPHFELISEEGPDHNKIFTVGAFFNKDCVGKGKGSSKQNASALAAENALKNLRWD